MRKTKQKATTRNRPGPSGVEFCAIWQESSSITEVSERTGLSEGAAHARATKYRRGRYKIPLKPMPRKSVGRPSLDIEAMRRVVGESTPGRVQLVDQIREQLRASATR